MNKIESQLLWKIRKLLRRIEKLEKTKTVVIYTNTGYNENDPGAYEHTEVVYPEKIKEGIAICTKCAFHTKMRYYHTCIAHVKPATNFVTGKRYLMGYEPCKEMNPCGKCAFYKEDKNE